MRYFAIRSDTMEAREQESVPSLAECRVCRMRDLASRSDAMDTRE